MPFLSILNVACVFAALFIAVNSADAISTEVRYCIENALDEVNNPNSECVYPTISSSQALIEMRDKWIVFMGESTMRQLFLQFIGIIDTESWNRIDDQKGSYKIEIRKSGSRFTFYYDCYYNNVTKHTMEPPKLFDGRLPDLLVLNDGLHDLLYAYSNMDTSWKKLAENIVKFDSQWGDTVPIIFVPPAQLHDSYLRKDHQVKATQFRNATLYKEVQKQKETMSNLKYGFFYNVFKDVSFGKESIDFDGVHSMERARYEAEGFVRALHYFNKEPALWGAKDFTVGQVMCFFTYGLVSIIVILGEIGKYLFYKVISNRASRLAYGDDEDDDNEMIQLIRMEESPSKAKSSKLDLIIESKKDHNGQNDAPNAAPSLLDINNNNENDNNNNIASKPKVPNGKSSDIDEPTDSGNNDKIEYGFVLPNSIDRGIIHKFLESYKVNQTIWRVCWQFGACIMILYLTDGPKHWFYPSLKQYDRDFFIFLHIIFLAISILTLKRNNHPRGMDVLGRYQTEEWKGIMQIVFVMYHYYDAAEVYNLIRVFIAAYVWMTGFGNTAYFFKRKDYSISRVFGMFFRLNWLVFWTCLMLNQQLMLYYICPLHTFFFLLCYFTWLPYNSYHEKIDERTQENKLNWIFIYFKLACVFGFLFFMFEISVGVFETIWSFGYGILEYHGTLYEWHFRTTLDHYATFLGMISAVHYYKVDAFFQNVEKLNVIKRRQIKGIIIAIVLVMLILWYSNVYTKEKLEYNAIHPYTSWAPIFGYIILRNVHGPTRPYYSKFLEWMGQITLETYIFQYHLFMIDDAKSILVMIEGYPLVNFLVVSCFYVFLSRIAFDATNTMRNYLYPASKEENKKEVTILTVKYISVIAILYGISYVIWLTVV